MYEWANACEGKYMRLKKGGSPRLALDTVVDPQIDW